MYEWILHIDEKQKSSNLKETKKIEKQFSFTITYSSDSQNWKSSFWWKVWRARGDQKPNYARFYLITCIHDNIAFLWIP